MENIEDLNKMKVADLKKHLKNKGLPVTGNKTELVERLQQALSTEENPALEASGAGDDDEFDEEEILGGEDVDTGKISQEEEAAALAGSVRVKDDSLLIPSVQKKISLKRSEPCLSQPAENGTQPEEETTEDSTKNQSTSEANKENTDTAAEEPKHKIIKLSAATSENPLEERAKKFGTAATPDTEEGRKAARASRFGTTDTNTNKKSAKLSTETGGVDLEKLKKRAERFGEVTSKSLSKVEAIEKMNQRKDRFGSSDSESEKKSNKDSGSDSEAAAKRAKRFGSSETGDAKVPVKAPVSEETAKQKRAERFAV